MDEAPITALQKKGPRGRRTPPLGGSVGRNGDDTIFFSCP